MTGLSSPQQALQALRDAYRLKLPAKVAELRRAVDGVREGGNDDWSEPIRLAHRLHGTGGSYGFDEISGVAAELEELLEDARGDADFGTRRSELLARLDALAAQEQP